MTLPDPYFLLFMPPWLTDVLPSNRIWQRWNDVLYTLTEDFPTDAFVGISYHVVQIPHQGTEDHHWPTAREELQLFL